jgi:hypothetical protein
MTNEKLAQIIKLSASSENTAELKLYWEKRYEEMFSRSLFNLSSKTIEMVLQQDVLSKPTTPFGDIILLSHLDNNKMLEETTLQSTVETAVRFLDGLLDGIKFTPDAKNTINQYRKIGIGIVDFKQYLESRGSVSDLDEIDYIGNLISSNAYRASESLAEEKGVCQGWDEIKVHVRPKSFEYWYDRDTGEIKNGLEINEIYTQESIKNTKYQIIPRRNSNILLLPPDLEWQIWADRDVSAPMTPNTEPVKTPNPEDNKENITNTELEMPNISNSFNSNQIPEAVSEIPFHQDNLDQMIPHLGDNSNPQEFYEESGDSEELPDFTVNNEEGYDHDDKQNPTFPPSNPEFQVGELVQILSNEVGENSKIYQVIDAFEDEHGSFQYKLTGGHSDLESKIWSENELSQVQLSDILDKINSPVVQNQNTIEEKTQYFVSAVITDGDKILVQKQKDTYVLPTGVCSDISNPEQSMQDVLSSEFGIMGNIVYEIGATTDGYDNSSLHFGFIVEIEKNTNSDLIWLPMVEAYSLDSVSNKLLNKLENQKNYLRKLESLVKDPPYNDQNNQFNIINNKSNLSTTKPQQKQSINYLKSNFMSQYTLKLEQFIQTNVFGNLYVVLQYDSTGSLKLLNMEGENMSPDLKHTLESVLNLVNFILINNISPIELAHQLDVEPKDGLHLPINDLLKVISTSLKEAPSHISDITPDILTDVKDSEGKIHSQTLPNNFENYSPIEQHSNEQAVTNNNIPENDSEDHQSSRGFFGQFGN